MADAVDTPQTTLRDTVAEAFDQHIPAEAPVQTAPSDGEVQKTAPEANPAAPAAERARDEKTGQFVKSEARDEKKPEPPAAQAPATAPIKRDPVTRPSSWGKDHWPLWEKLASGATLTGEEAYALAQLSAKREGEFAKGVSTYKTEFDRVKPVADALAPHLETIKSLGIEPAQFVSNLAQAHRMLSSGTQEQRLGMILKIAQDNGIQLQNLFVRGQDGQVYMNPQVQPFQAQAQQRAAPQVDVAKQVREEIAAVMGQQQIDSFAAEKDAQGNSAHPHFEAVREEMALLLDAGKAQDLKDAYQKAIRLHDDIFESEQEAKRKADEAARQDAQRKAVAAAKANAVSTKTATPSASASPKAKGSVRGAIEDAFDQHVAAGRV